MLMLRVWQDHREDDNVIHTSTLCSVQQLVKTALTAASTSNVTAEPVVAQLIAIKDRLITALFGCKAALALATEIVLNPG